MPFALQRVRCRVCEEFNSKPNNPTGNGQMKRCFLKRNKMANKYMKKCPITLVIRGRPIRATLEYHLVPVRRQVKKTSDNAGQDMEKRINIAS